MFVAGAVSVCVFLRSRPSIRYVATKGDTRRGTAALGFVLRDAFASRFGCCLSFILPGKGVLHASCLPLSGGSRGSMSFSIPTSIAGCNATRYYLGTIGVSRGNVAARIVGPGGMVLCFGALTSTSNTLLSSCSFSIGAVLRGVGGNIFGNRGNSGNSGNGSNDGCVLARGSGGRVTTLVGGDACNLPCAHHISKRGALALASSLTVPFGNFAMCNGASIANSCNNATRPTSSMGVDNISSMGVKVGNTRRAMGAKGRLFSTNSCTSGTSIVDKVFAEGVNGCTLAKGTRAILTGSCADNNMALGEVCAPAPINTGVIHKAYLPKCYARFRIFASGVADSRRLKTHVSTNRGCVNMVCNCDGSMVCFLAALSMSELGSCLRSRCTTKAPIAMCCPLTSRSRRGVATTTLGSRFPAARVAISRPNNGFSVYCYTSVSRTMGHLRRGWEAGKVFV